MYAVSIILCYEACDVDAFLFSLSSDLRLQSITKYCKASAFKFIKNNTAVSKMLYFIAKTNYH